MSLTLCAFFCLVALSLGQPSADKITSLPNYKGPALSQYSGYINVDPSHGRRLHYWFIESLNNPATDPVTVWLNGGPGCSSMDGLFYEMGPIHFNNIPNNMDVVFNPWTWVNVSSMLFIESPAGVGFSYSDTQSDYSTNDTQTGIDNFAVLQNFVTLFPNYRSHDLWVAGESYAGMYVPILANNIMDGIQKGFPMKFKGVLVGNGVTRGSRDRNIPDQFQWFYGHGLVSKLVWDQLTKFCLSDPHGNDCKDAQNTAYEGFDGFNPYYLYGDCESQRPLPKSFLKVAKNFKSNPPCVDSAKADAYLNSAIVKSAIHVNPTLSWTICSDIIDYSSDVTTVIPYYYRMLSANMKVLIYSGDADGMVDYTYSEWWTSDLKLTPTSAWRQWLYDDDAGKQVAGFVTEYKEGLAFATITGAGHMVPQTHPQRAYEMFARFIKGKPL